MSEGRPDSDLERHYTFSITEEDRKRSFDIEDRRWARGQQLRDWLILALLIAISLGYHLLVYFLEPGLR